MSFLNNLDYLYSHLPGRYRAADAGQDRFLKRFLTAFGEELDGFDEKLDTLFEKVSPVRYHVDEANDAQWIEFFLSALFGWGWFPGWFSIEQKRAFYAGIARLYAWRGTARGIEELLAAFGIRARVIVSSAAIGELCIGEDDWLMAEPLGIIVQVFPDVATAGQDLEAFDGEFCIGESHVADIVDTIERADLDNLLRFCWPLGQVIVIEDLSASF